MPNIIPEESLRRSVHVTIPASIPPIPEGKTDYREANAPYREAFQRLLDNISMSDLAAQRKYECIAALKAVWNCGYVEITDGDEDISGAFSWSATPQGSHFWGSWCDAIDATREE